MFNVLTGRAARSAAWRCIVLFVASIGFLHMLAHNVILLIPLAGFLLLGYFAIVLIDRGWLRLLSGAVIAGGPRTRYGASGAVPPGDALHKDVHTRSNQLT